MTTCTAASLFRSARGFFFFFWSRDLLIVIYCKSHESSDDAVAYHTSATDIRWIPCISIANSQVALLDMTTEHRDPHAALTQFYCCCRDVCLAFIVPRELRVSVITSYIHADSQQRGGLTWVNAA